MDFKIYGHESKLELIKQEKINIERGKKERKFFSMTLIIMEKINFIIIF